MTDPHHPAANAPQPTPELDEEVGFANYPKVNLFEICNPTQWPTISKADLTSSGFPVYGANGIIGYYDKYNHEYPTILITCRGATCGRINVSLPKSYVNGNAMALDDLDSKNLSFNYLLYFLKYRGFEDVITGSAQPQITRQGLEGVEIPLPPLAEQIRIADKLDTLLARVEAGRERLGRVPALLARLRQSILSAAVSGELTREWRTTVDSPELPAQLEVPQSVTRLSKHKFEIKKVDFLEPSVPHTWIKLSIAEMYSRGYIIDFADGNHGGDYPRKEEFGETGVPFLTAAQIGKNWEIDISSSPLLNAKKAQTLRKGWAITDDVILTHNATVGRVALMPPVNAPVLLGTSATFYRFNRQAVIPNFARILFSGNYFQEQLELLMEQTTRNQVPITTQVSLIVFLPPLPEQAEIVRRVELLFARVEVLERQYSAAAKSFELLTPALLQKAFRGALVPQDPADEPASVLLEHIRATRGAAGEKPRRGRGVGKAAAGAEAGAEGKRRGRPRKIEAAVSVEDAIARMEAAKRDAQQPGPEVQRAEGTRQVGLFED